MSLNQNKWMTEREAEQQQGIPREVVQVLSGRPLTPPAPADAQGRRRVVLAWWAALVGPALHPAPLDANGDPKVPAAFFTYLADDYVPRTAEEGNQLAAVLAYARLLRDSDTLAAVVDQVSEDLREPPPTVDWIAAEYDRYEAAVGCQLPRVRPGVGRTGLD